MKGYDNCTAKTDKKVAAISGEAEDEEEEDKSVYKIEDNSKDEKPKSSTKPLQHHHECSEDGEGVRSVRKSTRTAMVVMQPEREANHAALQATVRVSFIERKKEGEEKMMSMEEMLLEAPQTEIIKAVDYGVHRLWEYNNVGEIMIATVDNPSNADEWALSEMINQPELLQKATEELDAVVGRERLVIESDLSHLNYVKACAREAFRLHPVTPFNVPHVSSSDTTIDNYFIPKGSHVLLSRVGLGRNPKVWDEPLKFRPEQHLKDDGSAVVLTESDLRFITFSTGMNGCVGITLGTIMTVMLFARFLHGFSWDVPHDQSSIDLSESKDELFLARPLLACSCKAAFASSCVPDRLTIETCMHVCKKHWAYVLNNLDY